MNNLSILFIELVRLFLTFNFLFFVDTIDTILKGLYIQLFQFLLEVLLIAF